MRDFDTLIDQCRTDIRFGRVAEVAKRLGRLNVSQLPREVRLPLARICRLGGLHVLGIKILAPIVNPRPQGVSVDPSMGEAVEYAVLLLRFGALNEALERFERLEGEDLPEALLFRALAHFSRWEYEEAIPVLERYLESETDLYSHLYGVTQLAQALIKEGRVDRALSVLDEIRLNTRRNDHPRLLGRCHALRAQIFGDRADYRLAKVELTEAAACLVHGEAEDRLLLAKSTALIESLSSGTPQALFDFRAQAVGGLDWESAREADLRAVGIKFDKERFNHLIFGTPYAHFRDRVCSITGRQPDQKIYVMGPKDSPRLDLRTGEIDGRKGLNSGLKCHQLLEVLLRDFYQPLRIGGIFSGLFPDENFDIFSSPGRIHQLIRRTRRWLEQEEIPVRIHESSGFYSVEIHGKFSMRVPLERDSVERMNLHFNGLRAACGTEAGFSKSEAIERLGLSRRTVQRLIAWGLQNGKLERLGQGNATTYRIIDGAPTLRRSA